MSRKWERLVEKNRKHINKQRKKQGKPLLGSGSQPNEESETFKGRHWIMPSLLIAAAVLFAALFRGTETGSGTLYWVTIGLYAGLGLYHYAVRRPFISIGKDKISSLRYGGPRSIAASDIEAIHAYQGSVAIELKGKRRLVFSKVTQQLPVDRIAVKLSEFAKRNGVRFNDPQGIVVDTREQKVGEERA